MTLIFWINLFLLLYTFCGYPLCLLLLKKNIVKHNTFSSEYIPPVELILVVRNSESLIADKINSLRDLDYPKDKLSILIISDNSTDNTIPVIESLNYPEIRFIDNRNKTSKSACLNQAINLSKAEILFLTDVRQPIAADALKNLVRHFNDPMVGAVSGELVFRNEEHGNFSEGMDAYWRYEKFIRKSESELGSVPGVTGAIYALRRSYYQTIPGDTLLDDVLIPMNLVLDGKKVLFESDSVAYDKPSSDAENERYRKIRTIAGNWQLLAFKPALLNPFKNPIWIQYVSHKVLRLFAPLFLVLIFLSSLKLAQTNIMFQWFFFVQLTGYLCIILANYLPNLMQFRLIRIAHSFLMLMIFTVSGFRFFITGKHLNVWK